VYSAGRGIGCVDCENSRRRAEVRTEGPGSLGYPDILFVEIRQQANWGFGAVVVYHGNKLANLRIATTTVAQQFSRIDRLKRVGFEVDNIDPARRVAQQLFDGDIGPEVRLAGRDQDGIVIGDTIDGPGAEPRDHP